MGPEKIKPVKSEYTLLKVMEHYCKERDWGQDGDGWDSNTGG